MALRCLSGCFFLFVNECFSDAASPFSSPPRPFALRKPTIAAGRLTFQIGNGASSMFKSSNLRYLKEGKKGQKNMQLLKGQEAAAQYHRRRKENAQEIVKCDCPRAKCWCWYTNTIFLFF